MCLFQTVQSVISGCNGYEGLPAAAPLLLKGRVSAGGDPMEASEAASGSHTRPWPT